MQYRKLTPGGPDISLLGYGCMRFPAKGSGVDKELAFEQMKYAVDAGVNYFDTAYPYHGGKSEVILGEFIKKYNMRDKIYIADKLPAFLVSKKSDIEKYYTTQLSRLDVSCIDFYLMHSLTSFDDWDKLKSFGILDFVREKREKGELRFIGFSFHGRPEEFVKILEDHPWDFCQIQYNYIDVNYQAGEKGMIRAHELGVGVIAMEPLRGGLLAAQAPDSVRHILEQDAEKLSPAYWAMRFVMNRPEIGTVLSGMNNFEHIKENVAVANETTANSMTSAQYEVIERVVKVYGDLMKVPCTACNYCMPCPVGVDIPGIFADYNSKYFFGASRFIRVQYIGRRVGLMGGVKSGANLCIECGKCTKHCPQHIDIPQELIKADKELNSAVLSGAMLLAAKILRRKK